MITKKMKPEPLKDKIITTGASNTIGTVDVKDVNSAVEFYKKQLGLEFNKICTKENATIVSSLLARSYKIIDEAFPDLEKMKTASYYVIGSSASKVGLTGITERDEMTGHFSIQAGVLARASVEFYKNYVNDPIKYFKKHPEQLNEFWDFCDVDKRIMIIQETEFYMTHFNIFLQDKAFPDLKK